MRRMLAKLAALLRRKRTEAELSREVAAHLTLLEDEFRGQGLSEEEARLAARRSYGNVEVAKELHRDEWRFAWFESLVQDLRAAWRSLRKSPGFAATAVVSLALGIGANTAIFTLVNGVLLKKLPVAEPERIVQVTSQFPRDDGGTNDTNMFSYPVFEELRRQGMVFEDLVATLPRSGVLTLGDKPQTVEMEVVSGSYFDFFGVRPALGRLLQEQDDQTGGADAVCVLSDEAWRTYFGGDAGVVDRVVDINGSPMRVVGVAPPSFIGSSLQRRPQLWASTATFSGMGGARDDPNSAWLLMLGRLRRGLPVEAASDRLREMSPAIEKALPPRGMNLGAVYSLKDGSAGVSPWREKLRDPLTILMGAVVLVLLVASANLASLLLARMNDRRQEFSVKLSLGISRRRLLRQLFIETLLVAGAGGIVALQLSLALTRFLLDLYNQGASSGVLNVAPDSTVFLYGVGACLLTSVIAGLYPAWRASRTNFQLVTLAKAASSLRRSYARRGLVLVQVALAVVLLFGTILFTHSLRNLRTMDLGYRAENILNASIGRGNGTPSTPIPFNDFLERVRGLPGVESATVALPPVLSGGWSMTQFNTLRPGGESVSITGVYFMNVGPDYFKTLQSPLLRGREFELTDSRAAVIVNERLAELAWPGEDPVGQRISGSLASDAEVIGVVGNSKYTGVREEVLPIAYRAFFGQVGQGAGTVQVRYHGSTDAAISQISELVSAAAPGYAVSRAWTLEDSRDTLISQDRLLTFLSTLFGALGVGLALVGIYGLISYSVAQRTHEIGVRVSVGAQRSQIVRLVLSEATALVVLGIAVGVPLALALSRWLESLLYEVTPSDPLHVAVTLAVLLVGGTLAACLPALRATRINPLEALKCD